MEKDNTQSWHTQMYKEDHNNSTMQQYSQFTVSYIQSMSMFTGHYMLIAAKCVSLYDIVG